MCWMCVQNERRSYGYGGGVNRRSWNNKSTAAIKRSDTKYTICVTIIIYDKNKNG